MKLLIGLGNPGTEYNFTRHNVGFLLLDLYAKIHNLSWQKPKFGALWAKSGDLILLKPQDFYNLSGRAVQEFVHFYKLTPSDILVVCDDFDLEFGQIRYRTRGSSGGNNGLKSITSALGTSDFSRLRIGTNNPSVRQTLGDTKFVLGKFTPAEREQLPEILQSALARLQENL